MDFKSALLISSLISFCNNISISFYKILKIHQSGKHFKIYFNGTIQKSDIISIIAPVDEEITMRFALPQLLCFITAKNHKSNFLENTIISSFIFGFMHLFQYDNKSMDDRIVSINPLSFMYAALLNSIFSTQIETTISSSHSRLASPLIYLALIIQFKRFRTLFRNYLFILPMSLACIYGIHQNKLSSDIISLNTLLKTIPIHLVCNLITIIISKFDIIEC